MNIVNKDSFISNLKALFSFSCLIILARTTMLNGNGDSRCPNHVPDLKEKLCSHLPLSMR